MSPDRGGDSLKTVLRSRLPAFSMSDCGGLTVLIHGARTLLRPSGALWIASERTLVVADLHFEKGSAYASRGQLLPPYDTGETLERLEREVEAMSPARLVFLGDSFHDGRAEARLAPAYAARLAALASGRELVWVVGNHDADGPVTAPGEIVADMTVEGLFLTHEPEAGLRPGEVAGHLHPVAKAAGGGRSVRRRCFLTDGMRVILPAFGAYAGGLNVRDAAFAGMMSGTPLVCVLGRDRTLPLAWATLRDD